MSQNADGRPADSDRSPVAPPDADATPDSEPESLLELLADDDARELFERAGRPRTIPELAAECDVARSTAYRKVNRLVEADLLVPTDRPVGDTGHATEYRRSVERIEIEVGDRTDVEFST
ncbi:HTH domain protein [Natronomonas moolapensis 8.8.11]|uniref:HTH domain protein n=1 Tax=Natronomonas moolapensis (strain DSM 18674 / CECT 7526 / JCM 14361 / 8.8.11) TaxID=268739 RepID=M1XLK1_NATM8|nr:helix-turn-helix domain-containing protein [Natronomonas moolapensis]CCQ37863.1 HTH domain protein [Natronomonas moolapensis 8.8.11]